METHRIAIRLLAVAAAAGIAFLGVRMTAVEALPSTVLVGNRVVGDNPDLFFAIAGDGKVIKPDTEMLDKSRQMAVDRPLAPGPFLLAASDAMIGGEDRIAEQHLAIALHREPRLWPARLTLFQSFTERGETTRMTQELVVLSRLVPETNELFVATVGQLVIDPDTRRPTIGALGNSPLIGRVLDYLANAGADPAIALQLARARGEGYTRVDRDWQARLVANLVADGEYARARTLWRTFLPGDARKVEPLYNPGFEQLPGSRPFNWALADGSDDVGVAEPAQDRSLEVVYYGRTTGPLASQLMVLPAGRYALSYSSDGTETEDSAALAWTVTCADRSSPLATTPIKGSTEPRTGKFQFTVPADCAALWLRLTGTAKEFSSSRHARISGLTLRKAGS